MRKLQGSERDSASNRGLSEKASAARAVRRTTRLLGGCLAVGVLATTSMYARDAEAAEVTRVASSFEEGDVFDLHFGVSYNFDYKQAAILREWSNGAENRLAKDLVYRQQRHTITPQLEIGLYRDLSVYLALPVVVADNRNYSFDQADGADCIYPGGGVGLGDATCVNKTNSTAIRDGIIPRDGFDALEPDDPFNQFTDPDTELIFNAPTRRGLDQLHVGLKYMPLNQEKLPHMPKWVIGVEGRFAVGKAMKFSRDIATEDPGSNHTVGRRTHELGVWTALSRRYRFLEPFFGAYWRQALRAGGSQFENFGGAQDKVNPMSQTGMYFGSEIVPWERKAKSQKVSIILGGSADLHYNGREYSEVWELLADSPALVGTTAPGQSQCNVGASVDYGITDTYKNMPGGYLEAANSAANSGGCEKFSGITRVQDYGTFDLNATLNFHMGPYARLNFGANLGTTTRHFLTAASRGDAGRSGDPDKVDFDSDDVNPVRRDVVDNVGRRFAIDDVLRVTAFFNFLVTF